MRKPKNAYRYGHINAFFVCEEVFGGGCCRCSCFALGALTHGEICRHFKVQGQVVKVKMDLKLTDRTVKSILLLGSGLVLGYCAYTGYRIWKRRQFTSIDEGFEDVSKIEDSLQKRILVLGLENAGKTTIVSQIYSGSVINSRDLKPTEGFNVTTMETNGLSINIWEIGGRDNVRTYWPTFLQDTDILVFIVDAADLHKLSLAIKEVRWLIADDRLANVPVLLLANKQDLPNAISPQQVADALDFSTIYESKHRIKVLGTQTPVGTTERHPSIVEVEKTLLLLVRSLTNG
ncbi:hypothetical protein RUM44_000396 [Polyplax serrata]|uniref:Uncharacterized protein n=1 Tax=Polyplax serrata TaxID=468196 RepID=A0ABR1B6J6_POLSC